MPGRLTHLLERPLPLGVPALLFGMAAVALCPPAVRAVLTGLSALGSLAFAMTQFWFEPRPRWMRGVQFDRTARRSWWVLLSLPLLTALLCRGFQSPRLLAELPDAAVICGLPLLSCHYALSLSGRSRLS